MSEYIGSRISLLSKSDIRYAGILHEINSEKSTVALEQVTSFGTEGRRGNPDDEIAPSDSVYDYIVFRGSDVKDLRIEKPPKENKPPQVPDDPAILGSGSRPAQSHTPSQPIQNQQPQQQQQAQQPQQPQPRQAEGSVPQNQNQHHQPYPFFYPPPPGQRFGPHGGPPPGPGFPAMPYGPPPGWFPPPGQGFPHPGGPYMNQQQIHGHQGQQPPGAKPPQPPQPPAPHRPAAAGEQGSVSQQQSPERKAPVEPSSKPLTPAPTNPTSGAPTPPLESKPSTATALAPAAPQGSQATAATKPTPPVTKNGRIVPAVPLPSPKVTTQKTVNGPLQANAGNVSQPSRTQPSQAAANAAIQSATQAATAAVAAAMAKLPPAPGQKQQPLSQQQNTSDSVDNLTRKVNEMRTNDNIRTSRQPGTGGYAAGHRGRGRGGGPRAKVDVPATDFDFETSNAKFNKQDLVKEAIATGSPSAETPPSNGVPDTALDNDTQESDDFVVPSAIPYNRATSFFDNISSEIKDRDDTHGPRPGGREWRGEEQKKNVETFGQGSVDNNYRGGYRGRGRGRGFRGRGGHRAGGYRGGRGGQRGGRGSHDGTQDATLAAGT
ncbi:MAG: hypothetical protein M1833_001562 [Piccolia ochrophora]|nr:MAG: hypothetical protein M1833_001562 [Piccolia ochrophora]